MASQSQNPEEIVVVTGGAGFVGQHIVKHLMEQKEFPIREVRVFDVQPLKWHTGMEVKEDTGVTISQHQGDLRKLEDLQSVFKGASAVIHNASKVDISSLPDIEKLNEINVRGTENVIKACLDNNIKILIYTSSSSVERRFGPYGKSKRQAEHLILEANEQLLNNRHDRISTCALRLPGVYGEGYQHLAELLQDGGAVRKTLLRVGDDQSINCMAYAGNIAWAFVCAIRELRTASPNYLAFNPAGRAICLADDTPQKGVVGGLDQFATHFDVKWTKFAVPFWMMYFIASICQWISFLLQPFYKLRVPFCKELVGGIHCLPIYNQDEAKRYLRYQPVHNYDESLKNTVNYLRQYLLLKNVKI